MGSEIRLIVDAQRDLGSDDARATVRLVENADAPIAGLGLSGPEGTEQERDFVVLRQAADRLHLGLAVHAGEEGPPDKVRAALDDLGADRIAHGVAAAKDPDLIERLKRDAYRSTCVSRLTWGSGSFPLSRHIRSPTSGGQGST
jgi:adenosine deaminase